MTLIDQINNDLKEAMKARQEGRLRAIRAIKSAFLLAGTESGNKDIPDEVAQKALMKLAKQRKDSIEIFSKENRQDLVDKEKEELDVIETYLPKQMDANEVAVILTELIASTGAQSMKEVGKVMPLAVKPLSEKADGK